MKVSPLKIGVALVIIGIVWTGFIFDETEKKYDFVILKQSTSFETKLEFSGVDIGFYKLYMPEFAGEEVFVQILDPKENVIQEERIQTRMSVGYFDFDGNGEYTIKLTNISKNPIDIEIEFGNTNSQKMYPSGIILLVGSLIVITMAYFKIKNYKIEQPEENIS